MVYTFPFKRRADWLLVALIALICSFSVSAQAQVQTPPAPLPGSQPAPQSAPQPFTQEELKQLLGPIALYPDALIALILPASTVPSDLVLAARFVASKGDPTQVTNQPWDDSVKSLVRYPDIVKWMDQNLEWTTQLGEAFLNEPADVMNTIQELRAQARAAGNLIDTPQQKVVEDQSNIRIVPAEPEVIYVPQYDPEVVYVESYEPYSYGSYEYGYYPYESYSYAPYLGPALTFGIGFAVGPWLNYDCDWPRRRVCVGEWNSRWRDDWDRGWKRDSRPGRGGYEVQNTINVVNIKSDSAREWQPSPKIERQRWQRQRSYNVSSARENARERRNRGNDSSGRLSAVARPSRPNFGQEGAGGRDRAEWRRERDGSNVTRDGSERVRRPRSDAPDIGQSGRTREKQNGDWQQRSRRWDLNEESSRDTVRAEGRRGRDGSNVTRDGSERVRRPRSDAPDIGQSGRTREKQNGDRKERSRRGDQEERPSSPMVRQNPQSFERQQARRSDNFREQKQGANSDSVRSRRATASDQNRSRSQQSKRSISKAESDSRPQVRAKRTSSSSSVNRSQSQRSKVASSNKNEGSRQAKSGSSRPSSQRTTSNYSKSNRSQQPARVERSGGQPRSPQSYSRQDGQQHASAAAKNRGGGKNNGGKKGEKNKDND